MRYFKLVVFLSVLMPCIASAQAQRIIDMHIHCYDSSYFGFQIEDPSGHKSSRDLNTHFNESYHALKKNGVVKAVISGSPTSVETWMKRDTNHLFIRGLMIDAPNDFGMTPEKLEEMIKSNKLQVFGEIGPYYSGTTLSDSVWQPYLRICEKYDIPVAVHEGGGPPENTYYGSPKSRLSISDPFLIEDVLVRYPKLRIYMMHAGEVWYEHAVRLMMLYPQLYSDLGVLLWVTPYTQHYATEFLRQAKEAGCLDRVMYGTDQMVWPYAIETSLNYFKSLPFLTKKEKENILYNNAMKFLRLER